MRSLQNYTHFTPPSQRGFLILFFGETILGLRTYPFGLTTCLLRGSSELLASFRLFLECLTLGLLLCFLLLLLSCSTSLSEDDSEEEEELEEESDSSE